MGLFDRWSRDPQIKKQYEMRKRKEEIDNIIRILIVDITKISQFQREYCQAHSPAWNRTAIRAYNNNVLDPLKRSIPLCELAYAKKFIAQRPLANSLINDARHLEKKMATLVPPDNNKHIEALKRPLLLAYDELTKEEKRIESTAQIVAKSHAQQLLRRNTGYTSASTMSHHTIVEEQAFIESDLRQLGNHITNAQASLTRLSQRVGKTTVRTELVELRRNVVIPFTTFTTMLKSQIESHKISLNPNFENSETIMNRLNRFLENVQKVDSSIIIPNSGSDYYKSLVVWYKAILPILQEYQRELHQRSRDLVAPKTSHTPAPPAQIPLEDTG
ncbi:hypothetical protein HYV86_01365 [Candidatus Woesearchaeota archaeon]|nr:hypothetical protein [Candidatus Woesearchaeota archaeon]